MIETQVALFPPIESLDELNIKKKYSQRIPYKAILISGKNK